MATGCSLTRPRKLILQSFELSSFSIRAIYSKYFGGNNERSLRLTSEVL